LDRDAVPCRVDPVPARRPAVRPGAQQPGGPQRGELAGLTALATLAAIAVRIGWMFSVPYLAGLFQPGRRSLGALIAGRERLVIGFAGLRGAVSVAAALSIPATVEGTDFPERSTLIAVALGAIVLLLIIPALGLPAVLRLSGLAGSGDSAERERTARAALAEAALRRTDELSAGSSTPEHLLSRVREPYEWRLARLRGDDGNEGDPPDAGTLRRLRREAVEAQRHELRELARRGKVHGEVLRELQRDLDLEESRLR
jgi:CPA1 family monovalent cation:H+ antiporter